MSQGSNINIRVETPKIDIVLVDLQDNLIVNNIFEPQDLVNNQSMIQATNEKVETSEIRKIKLPIVHYK